MSALVIVHAKMNGQLSDKLTRYGTINEGMRSTICNVEVAVRACSIQSRSAIKSMRSH